MIKAYRNWKEVTNLSNGTFLKAYIYSRMIVNPRRKKNKLIERIKEIWRV